ncbi:fungal-specific transcription factor domain-containing protein [Cytidiella melzeri]|nr:fungal-specific transcription factor domain-containing protein [Cytidiella melzeri]
MALMTTAGSSTSGESHSSSPELSPDMDHPSTSTQATSPLSLPSSLNPALSDGHDSGRSSPARSSLLDVARSRPVVRAGCWTCRIRRKKCDEERVDGDSCKTCKRLGIKCLGWGSRRPDWMRDKEKVAHYKADIKAQLTRAGLIRGQPRAVFNPSSSTTTTTTLTGPSPSARPDRYPQSATAGPGPSTTTTLRSRRSDAYGPYVYNPSPRFSRPPSAMISAVPGLDPSIPGGTTNTNSHNSPASSPFVMPLPNSYNNHPGGGGGGGHPSPSMYGLTPADLYSTTPNNTLMSPFPSPQTIFDHIPHQQQQPHPSSVSPVTLPVLEPNEQLVSYYFEHVRKLQFAFAGQELTGALLFIIRRDPQGPLEHAICALASLHSTKMQMTGFDGSEIMMTSNNTTNGSNGGGATTAARPLHKRYFDQGHVLLMQNNRLRQAAGAANSNSSVRQYPEDDAIAAVFLIGYYMMVGGPGQNWLQLLELAYEWFAQTGLVEEQNPKLSLFSMTDVQRVAVKAVMWMDVLTSIIYMSSPRFLAVYRRLLGAGAGGFWASTGNERMELRMDKLTGCPDEAVLALAETAHLANWKMHEQQNGSLSMRELIRSGDQIEQALKRGGPFRSISASPTNEAGPGGGSSVLLPSGLPAPEMYSAGFNLSPQVDAARRAIPHIWRETAVLYLHTVMSDSHPGVPEIINSVSTLMDWYNGFVPSDLDRSILFPLILTAVLTDNTLYQDIIKQRITLHGTDVIFNGPMAQAGNLIEFVWQRRTAGLPIDWRECMRERWSSLVMV